MAEQLFPIQSSYSYKRPHPTQVPWSVADKAYSIYRAKHGSGQSLSRLGERGGFGPEEMDDYCPGWIEEAGEIAALRAQVEDLTQENTRLTAKLADLECDEMLTRVAADRAALREQVERLTPCHLHQGIKPHERTGCVPCAIIEHWDKQFCEVADDEEKAITRAEAAEAQVEQWKIDHPGCYEQMQSVGALQRERDMFMEALEALKPCAHLCSPHPTSACPHERRWYQVFAAALSPAPRPPGDMERESMHSPTSRYPYQPLPGHPPQPAAELARWARRQAGGFIDGCSADLVGSGPAAEKLCPVCEAIERVAVLAIQASRASSGAPGEPTDTGGGNIIGAPPPQEAGP